MTTDITGTTLLTNSFDISYDYYISLLGGNGSYSHNTIAKLVASGNYQEFTIRIISGIKHQALSHIRSDSVITNQAINDISLFIATIFTHYTNKPKTSIQNYKKVLEHFNIPSWGINSTSTLNNLSILSNLQSKNYEYAIANFIAYIDSLFTLSQTIINRLKSDLIALIHQLDPNLTKIDSQLINSSIQNNNVYT
jgi:hypothetical protein